MFCRYHIEKIENGIWVEEKRSTLSQTKLQKMKIKGRKVRIGRSHEKLIIKKYTVCNELILHLYFFF